MNEIYRLMSDKPCINYRAFASLITSTVRSIWGDRVFFTSAYPNQDVDRTPIITYKVVSKVPGAAGNNREIKPRVRYRVRIPDTFNEDGSLKEEGKTITVWGQWFDYRIQFDIWANSGEQADEITQQFQDFMHQYTGYFKRMGVSEIIFQEQVDNQSTGQWRAELINRSLIYYVRLDETTMVIADDIEYIDINTYVLPYLISQFEEAEKRPYMEIHLQKPDKE